MTCLTIIVSYHANGRLIKEINWQDIVYIFLVFFNQFLVNLHSLVFFGSELPVAGFFVRRFKRRRIHHHHVAIYNSRRYLIDR